MTLAFRWLAVMCGALVLAACDPARPSAPAVGSNSNWLRACGMDEDCKIAPSCLCGGCSAMCSRDSDCDMLGDARCAANTDPATIAACRDTTTAAPSGVCLPRCKPGGCRDGQSCVAQACVLTPMPQNAFCQPVTQPAVQDRTLADELLALLQDRRTRGGFFCGGTASPAAPALRVDVRLLCAARVFAADVAVTHARTLVHSQGRQSDQRMALAGYTARVWGESFATQAKSADDALQTILTDDPNACTRFSDPRFTDVGVASASGTAVISVGSEH